MAKKTNPIQAPPLSPTKRRAFTLIMLLLPLLLLVATEFILRGIEYGGNLDLVIKRSVGGKEFYSINRGVAKRYFAQSVSTVPEPAEDLFEIKKSKKTKRIFCLGESTMAGFPFEFHATAPSFMKDQLQVLLPEYNIEVINVGLSAVGSYVVKDFMDELNRYEPDLYVVYVGHNEFYGAYGVGSSVAVKGGAWMTRLTVRLLKFKTFLALRDGYAWLQRTLWSPASKSGATLMGEMVGDQAIPYGSELYNNARQVYRDNLNVIIETARSQDVQVIFSSLVSNIKTQAPFVSIFDPNTTEQQKQLWHRLVSEGDSLCSVSDTIHAIEAYRQATATDTLNATAFFKLGTCLYAAQQFGEAKSALRRAKDLDGLRFRMSEDFENDLSEVCNKSGVTLSLPDSSFEAASPHGIIGNELILEHLHPNIRGYSLMAKTWTASILQHGFLTPREEWKLANDKSDEEYMDLSTVSEFDETVGRIKVELLMHKWPFQTGAVDSKFTPANPVDGIAFEYVRGRVAWSDARYKLGGYYAGQKQYALARKECLAVAKVLPFSYQPLFKVADYYREEGKTEEAKAAYLHCIEVENNPFARMKLAIILLEEDKLNDAIAEIGRALDVERKGPHKFQAGAASSAHYLLGVAFAKQSKFQEARTNLLYAISINPGNAEAKSLLERLPR